MDKGLITKEQLDFALTEQKRTKEFLGSILVHNRAIVEKDLLIALSEQFQIPVGVLKNKYIEWETVKRFNPSLIMDYRCFPVEKDEWSVTFAILNPLDFTGLKKAEESSGGLKARWMLVSEADMNDAIERYQQLRHKEIDKWF